MTKAPTKTKVRLHLLRVTGGLEAKDIEAMFRRITKRKGTRADIAEVRRELNVMRRDEEDVRGGS